MIQYVYLVKCPNCEDEPFDFFDEAKSYALGCLNQQPIITQIEVDRNDFGECQDSNDLGTVWSWEEMISDKPVTKPTMSKRNTFACCDDHGYCADRDPEFLNLDNSLDSIPDNFCMPATIKRPIPAGMTIDDLVEELEANEEKAKQEWDRTHPELKEASLGSIAQAAYHNTGVKCSERDILDRAGVQDDDYYADIDTWASINREEPLTKYATLRRARARKEKERRAAERNNSDYNPED